MYRPERAGLSTQFGMFGRIPALWQYSIVTEFPAHVEDRYRRLAEQRRWTPEVRAAFRASVGWYRALDEDPGPRCYFEYVDEEGLSDKGSRWLWEAVIVDGDVVAIKQIEVPSSGPSRRYWWQHLEDDTGMLTDQALETDQPGITPITRSAFYALWDSVHS
ncbi:hypothetical protein SAMN05661093_00001 [Kibdelosporangium aridum]|uniref:Uncharacterized protein n=2 Tax=Kibdelosporangium aridum TaxID=2030 RepID=A0A1W1ZED2_KIBAR|nr:hypothetical protein SAMN05661093_00001 [Kibdelosporangium aridum]